MCDREKLKHYLQMLVSEFLDGTENEVAFEILACIMTDTLLDVINEELHNRYPKAPTICYEVW